MDGEAADRAGVYLSVLTREGDLKDKLCYVVLDYEGEMGKARKIIEQTNDLPDGSVIAI